MKQFLRRMYYETDIGYWLIAPAKFVHDFARFRLLPERTFLKREFRKCQGYELNLDDPKTLNEKIQWLKLHDRNPLLKICADKFAVRQYIREKIGGQYLVPLVFHTRDPAEIISEKLPDYPFVIKTNHSSGNTIIVMDKSKMDWKRVQRKVSISLKANHYYRTKEWQYKEIKPCVLVEKLLIDNNGALPLDYKLHCCHGRVAFIQVDIDRHTDHKRNLYTCDWELMDCLLMHENGGEVPRPGMLDKMRLLAEVIAKEFSYVRVDFYNVESDVYFGELTFHAGSGFEVFSPVCWDRKLGDSLILQLTNRDNGAAPPS